ncbi:MAG: thiamine pyrophosphate-dependent enzyme [Bryobacteraceae bacterium]
MGRADRLLLSGDEAVALAAIDARVNLGTGYPGTPSTEILEAFHEYGGKSQWAPNEKVALEVGIGVSFSGGRSLVTMKHVGLNVAADPLFTVAYTGVSGALVIVVADDPGLASSQNEQDSRHYATAAGLPMIEPSDSQEAYNYIRLAVELSEAWGIPVLFRMTTRVCHSKTVVRPSKDGLNPPSVKFERNIRGRVMIPSNARPAHQRLRQKLHGIAAWNETSGPRLNVPGDGKLGIITSGVAYEHAREAAPDAAVLKLGMTNPLPIEAIRTFAAGVERCVVVEEGDPYLENAIRAAGIAVTGKPEVFYLGELNVPRARRLLNGDSTPEPAPAPATPPQLCQGCPHRIAFQALRDLDCIVSGDIGCYSLGALPPFEAMDTLVCMGAAIGVGLGMRHTLPRDQARRVVSVIGDSTFIHSGITGLVEMIYNPPPDGHVVLVLDNGTTAMTGLQEHPGTGRNLGHEPTGKVKIEDVARALGIRSVHVVDPAVDPASFRSLLKRCLDSGELSLIVARRPCLLAAGKIKEYEKCNEQR